MLARQEGTLPHASHATKGNQGCWGPHRDSNVLGVTALYPQFAVLHQREHKKPSKSDQTAASTQDSASIPTLFKV